MSHLATEEGSDQSDAFRSAVESGEWRGGGRICSYIWHKEANWKMDIMNCKSLRLWLTVTSLIGKIWAPCSGEAERGAVLMILDARLVQML